MILAKSAGFCYGVERAVKLARDTAGERGTCWMLGDIIHNSHVVEELDRLGVRRTDDPAARAEAYDEFQQALSEDPAFAFLCYIDASYVAVSGLSGIDGDTVLGHHGTGIFRNVAEWTIER